MPGGRPTSYEPEVIAKAIDYLERYDQEPYNNQIPTVVGLCKAVKRSRSIIYTWGNDPEKPEFSDILSEIKEYQEMVLLDGGLEGRFQPTITKLALSKHGYKDQSALTGADDKPLIPDNTSDMELARRAVFLMTKVLKDAEDSD